MLRSRIVIAAALALGSALLEAEPASAAEGCGPGAWRGLWGHCRNTPYTAASRTDPGSFAKPTTVARQATGAARGVTAATRRITAGCRTAIGSKRAPIDDVVAPSAMPSVDRLANECIESLFDILAREQISKPPAQDFLMVANPAVLEPWSSLLARNTPGVLLRVGHGSAGHDSAITAVGLIADRFAGHPALNDCAAR
jgi:hypothetical protein